MAPMFRALAVAGALAGTTILAAPAAAASTVEGSVSPIFDVSRPDIADAGADWGCRGWRCGGWGGGWRGRGWRRNRIDGGDILIGAAIIGGAIAIANSNNRRRERERDVVIVERDVRDQTWRDEPRRYDDRRASPRGTGASGLDNAVNQCLDRIERDVRVDNVERTGAGWRVSGVLFNGSPFQCRIGNGGQIDGIDYGGGFGGVGFDAAPASGQWDDSRYSAARAGIGGTVRPDMAVQEVSMRTASPDPQITASGAMPAYPGGPIPGEAIPETMPEPVDGDL